MWITAGDYKDYCGGYYVYCCGEIMWITVKDYVDYCGEGLCGLLRGIINITVEGDYVDCCGG